MKIIKRLIMVFFVGAIAALGVIFWPKIREHCDRWLADNGECDDEADVDIVNKAETE